MKAQGVWTDVDLREEIQLVTAYLCADGAVLFTESEHGLNKIISNFSKCVREESSR